ncbi:MAG: cytochrome c [bacterium]|nr:cytochrome c [bacterium]
MLGLNIPIVLGVVAVMLVLRWRKVGMFTWALAWWLALALFLKFGFAVPIPGSVLQIYMGIVTGSLLVYISSSKQRWADATRPVLRLILDPGRRLMLAGVVVLLPAVAALSVWAGLNVPLQAPGFGRTVHPAPPNEVTVHDNAIDLVRGDNPYRHLEHDDPDAFGAHVENGRRVYYENCFYCHGDYMGGDGMFAHALNPIPTNFTDVGVLPNFQESFIFWRVSKGGPGLPEAGGPWDTAMPAWENFLTEEEMWDVVAFLYEFNNYDPRALHDLEGH